MGGASNAQVKEEKLEPQGYAQKFPPPLLSKRREEKNVKSTSEQEELEFTNISLNRNRLHEEVLATIAAQELYDETENYLFNVGDNRGKETLDTLKGLSKYIFSNLIMEGYKYGEIKEDNCFTKEDVKDLIKTALNDKDNDFQRLYSVKRQKIDSFVEAYKKSKKDPNLDRSL